MWVKPLILITIENGDDDIYISKNGESIDAVELYLIDDLSNCGLCYVYGFNNLTYDAITKLGTIENLHVVIDGILKFALNQSNKNILFGTYVPANNKPSQLWLDALLSHPGVVGAVTVINKNSGNPQVCLTMNAYYTKP